jgi:hypothetical protein
MTSTFTADPNAQLMAKVANDYLSPAPGTVRQLQTFAEWNALFERTGEPIGEVGLTSKITFGEWVAAATGWMGYVTHDVLMHLFRFGMTSTERFDNAAETFVFKQARGEEPEKKPAQDWWEHLGLSPSRYKSRFETDVEPVAIALPAFLNRILETDLSRAAWYARLRCRLN